MSSFAGPGPDGALAALNAIVQPIDKYMFMRRLRDEDEDSYYRLLMGHAELVLPFIYTPTVGEACQKYHQLPGLKTHGLYLTLQDRGHILDRLQAWPQQHVRVVVVTDGERILGLGDLGTGGMGISEGKITLYTVAAGVCPTLCLPVCLDVGTNNKQLLDDPSPRSFMEHGQSDPISPLRPRAQETNDNSYPGLRQPRVRDAEYFAFLDEFMAALQRWQPHVLLQFEDFGNVNAFRLLDRYRGSHCCFNDDIQGTAAITLAALLAAVKSVGASLGDQRILFLGAGEAGTGIGELIAYCIHRSTGLSRQESRARCFFMDSKGLVCASRPDELAHHKQPFAHDIPHVGTLLEAIHAIKPTALIGVSTIQGAFNEAVIKAMSAINPHPIIFPLSNPTSKSECTFQEAFKWSDGRVIFASGSPFDPIATDEQQPGGSAGGSRQRVVCPAQANNAYIFPAVGLAAILTQSSHLTDEAFLVAAQALAEIADPQKVLQEGALFPPFHNILDVSAHVASVLGEHLVSTGAGTRPRECVPGKSQDETYQLWRRFVDASIWRSPGPAASRAASLQIEPELLKPAASGSLARTNSRL